MADRRISQMHSLSDAAVQTTLDQLNAESRGLSESPRMTRELATQTDAAIEQLIREILE